MLRLVESIKVSGFSRYKAGMSLFFLSLMNLCLAACTEAGSAVVAPPPSVVQAPVGAGGASADENQPIVYDEDSVWVLNPHFAAYWSHENAFLNRADYFEGSPDPDEWAGYKLGIVRGETDDRDAAKAGAYYRGQWVLSWDGSAKLSLGGRNGRLEQDGSNRIIETFSGQQPITWAEARSLNFSDVAYYRFEDEAAFTAGERFSPDFVRLASQYNILRPLDWSGVNNTYVNKSSAMKPADAARWAGGPPVEAQFDLAAKAKTALWLNIPAMIGVPDDMQAEAIAAAELPAAPGEEEWKTRQKAQLAVFARAFEPALASAEWDILADRLVAALEASGYPLDRQFYLELGNEAWGTHFINGIYFWGMHDAFFERTGVYAPGQPMQGAYGYFTARFACAFGKALKAAGREEQAWTMVVNSQLVWTDQTKGALEGVKAFRCGADTQPMSRYGVAIAGYWQGGFKWSDRNGLFGRPLSQQAWTSRWLQEFRADPEALAQRIENYLTHNSAAEINNAYIIQQSLQHKTMAAGYGARFIGQYEGGNHDNIDNGLKASPGVMDFARAYLRGEHNAAVIRDLARRMKQTMPDAINANYHHWGPRYNPDQPWDTAPVWDQNAPASRAMRSQLRAPR